MLQLAWLVADSNGVVITRHNHYISRPELQHIEGLNIHGITKDLLDERGEPLKQILAILEEDMKKCKLLVAHNLNFDKSVILSEYYRNGILSSIEHTGQYCTMLGNLGPDGRYLKLDDLYCHLFGKRRGGQTDGRHNAFDDVLTVSECFYRLINNGLRIEPKYDFVEKTALLVRFAVKMNFERQIKALYDYCFQNNIVVAAVYFNENNKDNTPDKRGTDNCLSDYKSNKVNSISFMKDADFAAYFCKKGISIHQV